MLKLLKYLGIAFVIFLIIKILSGTEDNAHHDSLSRSVPSWVHDDADLLLYRCGTPETDDSTVYDKPRPPIVTRWVVYKKGHIKIVFVPRSGRVGDPPPYNWKLFGVIDTKTNKTLKADEVFLRLPCWRSTTN